MRSWIVQLNGLDEDKITTCKPKIWPRRRPIYIYEIEVDIVVGFIYIVCMLAYLTKFKFKKLILELILRFLVVLYFSVLTLDY